MYEDLKERFNNKIVRLYENEFQSFLDKAFTLFYGENYIPTRQQHDKGNDGCLEDKTRFFAVYAPEKGQDFSTVEKKFESDFKKYKANWSVYKNFTFVYNNPEINITDISADELKLADKYNADFWNRGYLLKNIIGKLSFSKLRKLAIDVLGIQEEQYRFCIIKWVVYDLTQNSNQQNDKQINYEMPIGIEDKIKKNFLEDNMESVKEKMRNFQKDFSKLKEIFQDGEISKILKYKILEAYQDSNPQQTFKERITIMKKNLSRDSEDDSYLYYVECIIFYIFEQCLIGEK